MNIYSGFKPTFLYIKQHSVTGLLYFGKTTRDVTKYMGSGKYWQRHIKKYGKQIDTLWYCLYTDEAECKSFAKVFSEQNNIVNSSEWANLIEENGLDGAPSGHFGHTFTEEERNKISKASKKAWDCPEYKEKMRRIRKETANRPEVKEKTRINSTGRKWTESQHKKSKEYRATNEYKDRVSNQMKNLVRTETHCKKISDSLSGLSKTESHKLALAHSKWIKYQNVCRISDRKLMTLDSFLKSEKWQTAEGRKKSEEHKNRIVWATHNMLCVLQTREIISRKQFMKLSTSF